MLTSIYSFDDRFLHGSQSCQWIFIFLCTTWNNKHSPKKSFTLSFTPTSLLRITYLFPCILFLFSHKNIHTNFQVHRPMNRRTYYFDEEMKTVWNNSRLTPQKHSCKFTFTSLVPTMFLIESRSHNSSFSPSNSSPSSPDGGGAPPAPS